MLRCQDVAHRASDYIDGELGWRERFAIWLHLLTCRHCRAFVGNLARALPIYRRLRQKARPDPHWQAETMNRVCQRLQQQPAQTEAPDSHCHS